MDYQQKSEIGVDRVHRNCAARRLQALVPGRACSAGVQACRASGTNGRLVLYTHQACTARMPR